MSVFTDFKIEPVVLLGSHLSLWAVKHEIKQVHTVHLSQQNLLGGNLHWCGFTYACTAPQCPLSLCLHT